MQKVLVRAPSAALCDESGHGVSLPRARPAAGLFVLGDISAPTNWNHIGTTQPRCHLPTNENLAILRGFLRGERRGLEPPPAWTRTIGLSTIRLRPVAPEDGPASCAGVHTAQRRGFRN